MRRDGQCFLNTGASQLNHTVQQVVVSSKVVGAEILGIHPHLSGVLTTIIACQTARGSCCFPRKEALKTEHQRKNSLVV